MDIDVTAPLVALATYFMGGLAGTVFMIWLFHQCTNKTESNSEQEDGQVEKLKREKNRLLRKLHQQPFPIQEQLETYTVKDIPNRVWSNLADIEICLGSLEKMCSELPREKNMPEELRLTLIRFIQRIREL